MKSPKPLKLHNPPSTEPEPPKDLATLKSTWTTLYKHTLPSLARSKAPSQPHWPIHLDHCFARIILDAVLGTPTSPWPSHLASPAIHHMTASQLESSIALGTAIAHGTADLDALNKQSLSARNKQQNHQKQQQRPMQKRKKPHTPNPQPAPPPKKRPKHPDIRTALGLPLPPKTPPASPPPPSLHTLITHSPLTPFRKRVLHALTQVPRGRITTYLALSQHLSSSPRAVGNALRHNPFAPAVPCHRVVAADLSIGGFGGEWGVEGRFCGEKVGLLRGEGVVVLEGEGRVRGVVWEGFV